MPETICNRVQRYTEKQLVHFILFIQSPHITTDMPFGERKLKLSNGENVIVPDIIRNIIPTELYPNILPTVKKQVMKMNSNH